jgi:hypothetical protein
LLLAQVEDASALSADVVERLQEAFARGHGHGLLQLGASEWNGVVRDIRLRPNVP